MLKWVAVVVAVLGASAGSLAIFIAVRGISLYDHPDIQLRAKSTPEAVAHGRKLVRLLCMDCHFDPTTRALTGKRMRDVPVKVRDDFRSQYHTGCRSWDRIVE